MNGSFWRRTGLTVVSFTLAWGILPRVARAEAPPLLNVQGVVRASDGEPANGTFSLRFALYEAQTAGTAFWSEVLPAVQVTGGTFAATLGLTPANPLPADLFAAHDEIWLGVRVEAEAELPRQRLVSVPYAIEARHTLEADTALGLQCSGCVTVDQLAFDPATQAELTALSNQVQQLSADPLANISCTPGYLLSYNGSDWVCAGGYITSAALADYATLADLQAAIDGLGATLGQLSCADGQIPIFEGTGWQCGSATMTELPPDGLNEISNDLLTNQFVDTASSATTPVSIPDNNPIGVADQINFPNIGIAQDLTVTIDVTNSNISGISVYLYDPDNTEYLLYNRGATGPRLSATYPAPTSPVQGDLAAWVGRNPQGIWRLKVIDHVFLNNTFDGRIESWSIHIQTLSNRQVEVRGNLIVDGNISGPGGLSIDGALDVGTDAVVGGDLHVAGNISATGSIAIGNDDVCAAAADGGKLRWNPQSQLQLCTGAAWRTLYPFALGSLENPASSCRAILDGGASNGDGVYFITVGGSVFPLYCDMTNGGWTYLSAIDASATFTTCGKKGREGPSQAECDAEYRGTPLVSRRMTVANGIQTWTVPKTGTYRIEVWGAAGANGCTSCNAVRDYSGSGPRSGGNGARMRGEFSLTQGQVLKILVGQVGSKEGLDGGTYSHQPGGGGGGTFVTLQDNTPLIVAGGGGGGGQANYGQTDGDGAVTDTVGTNNGGTGGAGGGGASSYNGAGAGITGNGSASSSVAAASFVNGGRGGYNQSHALWSVGGFGGGGAGGLLPGGGGGYSGGGCSGSWSGSGRGGGGGSYNNGSNQSNTSAANDGPGRVLISFR